ncbi:hypothetical protein F4808DRAFT_245663 [Astrocystis sublimbata]|nr:hypothetical protein F4808DRAFT_245663 [Astrocystis sublimbata]
MIPPRNCSLVSYEKPPSVYEETSGLPVADKDKSLSSDDSSLSIAQTSPVKPSALIHHSRDTDSAFLAMLNTAIYCAKRDYIPFWREEYASQISSSRHDVVFSSLRHLGPMLTWMTGAAGELYVFELLSNLLPASQGLPSFDTSNWQSRMRNFVTVHPKYSDMENWKGSETFDFTYLDTEGVLTNEFIKKRYLKAESWAGKRPFYFIEVKSTTGSCERAMYIDKTQYQRMRDNNDHAVRYNILHVIFRVYWLSQENIGLEVHFNPQLLRRTNRLTFR